MKKGHSTGRGMRSPRAPRRPPKGGELAAMRALAHPLRVRLLELFAERPRTTKQAAEELRLPPTRLYHHVHALEKGGLLRLRETRRVRGTHEKYYETTLERLREGFADGARPSDADLIALASSILEAARLELALLQQRGAPWRYEDGLLARLGVRSRAAGERLQRDLQALIRRHTRKVPAKGHDAAEAEAPLQWSLTLLLLPLSPREEEPAP